MESYMDLAVRYVKHNKRRSILTVCGVTVSVMVLYVILNLFWSYLLNYRNDIRKEADYEIVLFTETREQIDKIMADGRVKDATVGRYYSYDYYAPIDYENALFINTDNPYRMERILKELTDEYQVEGTINKGLAATYLQGAESNLVYIAILVALLVSYICAIFGVGIIRNSIQLTMLEHIKDFGNLRCIGASRSQLKAIIYIQGALMEIAGIVLGVLLGWGGSMIGGALLRWDFVGFHLVPIPFIALAFLADLYFAMGENAKLVTKLTPVSAIRGEFRIKKEKLKRRKRSLWGLIFGLEGDYAYKNVRRHSGRFVRTVAAMSLGIAAAMLIFGISNSLAKVIFDMENMFGYYHIYYMSDVEPNEAKDEMMKNLPPTELLSQVSALPELTEGKRLYTNGAMVADFEEELSHYTEDYLKNGVQGNLLDAYHKYEDEIKAGGKSDVCVGDFAMWMYNIPCSGYDKEDIERYKDVLVDGTLDVSDHGLILVNGGYAMLEDDEYRDHVGFVEYTDYKVGDEIEFLDTEVFRDRYNEELAPITLVYEEQRSKKQERYDSFGDSELTEEENSEKNALYKEMQDDELEYYKTRYNLICAVYNEVIAEGHTVTYTIEGIVSKDVNMGMGRAQISIVLPLNNYYALTSTDETWTNGMMYHFDHFPVGTYMNRVLEDDYEAAYTGSGYAEYMSFVNSYRSIIIIVGLIILFIVAISVFNLINTTASDMYLRRKELAQLRVLGVSKRKLYKMVMLEGVIQAILSSIFGILLGTGLGFVFFESVFGIIFGYHYVFPITAMIIAVTVTVLILCGAVYFPLKRLPNDVAADLATAGE